MGRRGNGKWVPSTTGGYPGVEVRTWTPAKQGGLELINVKEGKESSPPWSAKVWVTPDLLTQLLASVQSILLLDVRGSFSNDLCC